MKVVHATQYRCDICGHASTWGKTWCSITFWLGHVWEHEFHICSVDCEKRLAAMKRKEKQALANQINKTLYGRT